MQSSKALLSRLPRHLGLHGDSRLCVTEKASGQTVGHVSPEAWTRRGNSPARAWIPVPESGPRVYSQKEPGAIRNKPFVATNFQPRSPDSSRERMVFPTNATRTAGSLQARERGQALVSQPAWTLPARTELRRRHRETFVTLDSALDSQM